MSRRPMRLLPLLTLLLLTNCAKTTDSVVTSPATAPSSFCVLFQPVRWSVHDTDSTILQIKKLNAKWVAICGAKP